MTSVEWLFEKLWQLPKDKFTWYNVLEQAKEMEKNSYICSKCKSQINGNEVVQQMQDSQKSD